MCVSANNVFSIFTITKTNKNWMYYYNYYYYQTIEFNQDKIISSVTNTKSGKRLQSLLKKLWFEYIKALPVVSKQWIYTKKKKN